MTKIKILIIDDDYTRKETYETVLKGFEVTLICRFAVGAIYPEFDICILDYYLSHHASLDNQRPAIQNKNTENEELCAPDVLNCGNPIVNGPIIIISDQVNTFVSDNKFTREFNKLICAKCQPSYYYSFAFFQQAFENIKEVEKAEKAETTINESLSLGIKKNIKTLIENCKDKIVIDILVIAALDTELQPFIDLCDKDDGVVNGNLGKTATIKQEDSEKKLLLLTNNQQGRIDTLHTLYQAKEKFDFKHIVMIGVCGADSEQAKLGNIMIPEASVAYQFIKENNENDDPRTPYTNQKKLEFQKIDTREIKNIAKNFYDSYDNKPNNKKPENKPEVNRHNMLCGDSILNKEGRVRKLAVSTGNSQTASVDMESYAIYYFAEKNQEIQSSLVIKSVMDYAGDIEKTDHYKTYCQELSAHVLFEMIKQKIFYNF